MTQFQGIRDGLCMVNLCINRTYIVHGLIKSLYFCNYERFSKCVDETFRVQNHCLTYHSLKTVTGGGVKQ